MGPGIDTETYVLMNRGGEQDCGPVRKYPKMQTLWKQFTKRRGIKLLISKYINFLNFLLVWPSVALFSMISVAFQLGKFHQVLAIAWF